MGQHGIRGDAKALQIDGVLAEIPGPLCRSHDGTGGPIAVSAAIEDAQGPGNDRCVEHLFDRNPILEMGLGTETAIVVVLHFDLGERLPGLCFGEAVGLEVALRDQAKRARRRSPRFVDRMHAPARPQPRVPGVLELLDA
jgi:hypothetical protein